jgi:hypothetical protein
VILLLFLNADTQLPVVHLADNHDPVHSCTARAREQPQERMTRSAIHFLCGSLAPNLFVATPNSVEKRVLRRQPVTVLLDKPQKFMFVVLTVASQEVQRPFSEKLRSIDERVIEIEHGELGRHTNEAIAS